MKKVFLLTITAGLAVSSFAQNKHFSGINRSVNVTNAENPLYRTTNHGTVDTIGHFHSTDSLKVYVVDQVAPLDSGFIAGMNPYGDHGFAERYDFTSHDSTLQVLGEVYLFTGTVNSASTSSVNFKAWSQGAQTPVDATNRPHLFYSGFPSTTLASASKSYTALGLNSASIVMYTTPTAYLSSSFFVGCELTYTWGSTNGDTLSLVTNKDGQRTAVEYTVSGADTIINNQSVTELVDNTWDDNLFGNFGLDADFALFAIVKTGTGLSVNGISNKGFTFYGSYPNPAVNSTNVKYGLATASDVTIQVLDMSGRVIKTINETNMSAGEHVSTISTSDLASGEYLYAIHSANGGGIASTFTVAK